MSAEGQLELAKLHLERVLCAWDEPDWPDLSLYGFYCLENAVCAAATHVGINFKKTHPSKVAAAEELTETHGLPDVSELLVDLNDARKASAYGDIDRPDLDAQNVAEVIENYVKIVEDLLEN